MREIKHFSSIREAEEKIGRGHQAWNVKKELDMGEFLRNFYSPFSLTLLPGEGDLREESMGFFTSSIEEAGKRYKENREKFPCFFLCKFEVFLLGEEYAYSSLYFFCYDEYKWDEEKECFYDIGSWV